MWLWLNEFFLFSICWSVPEIFAIKVGYCKNGPNFARFWPQFFGGAPPNFWSGIIKFSPIPTMWQSFRAIGRGSSEIRRLKKKHHGQNRRPPVLPNGGLKITINTFSCLWKYVGYLCYSPHQLNDAFFAYFPTGNRLLSLKFSEMPVADGSFGWRWLVIFWRLNQCESAGDGLALNRLALARNGGGLQV